MGLEDWMRSVPGGSPLLWATDKMGITSAPPDPYQQVKDANKSAGQQAKDLGQQGMDFWTKWQQDQQKNLAPAQNAYQSMYGAGGSMTKPGAMEQLYQQRSTGQDKNWNDSWNRTQSQGLARMGQQAAARGNFNSGGAQAGEGAYVADLASKQSQAMASMAQDAQQLQQQREGGGLSAALGLGAAQTGINQYGSTQGWGAMQGGSMADINAQLAAAGVDLQRFRDDQQYQLAVMQMITSVGGKAVAPAPAAA